MTFELKIRCDNAAFDDDLTGELGRILEDVAQRLDPGNPCYRTIFDLNGNDVGRFRLAEVTA